jgi:hypothetical protein
MASPSQPWVGTICGNGLSSVAPPVFAGGGVEAAGGIRITAGKTGGATPPAPVTILEGMYWTVLAE